MLTQEGHVISYESGKLKTHENDYATYDLELAAMIHALKMWCHRLIGKIFSLMSNNISLKYLFDQQNLNSRKAKWLAFLREYDFEIKHIKGKENKVVDGLRRNALTSFIASISSYKTKLEDKLEEGISIDQDKIKSIIDWHVPKDVTDVRSFMGITGYYRKFIEGFSKIANPITSLQKKGKRFV